MNQSILKRFIVCILTVLASVIFLFVPSGCTLNSTNLSSEIDHGGEGARNMRLVGYNDLQGRSAYEAVILKRGERWFIYIGHHNGDIFNPLTGKVEANGVSVLDITDPSNPIYLAHIPCNQLENSSRPLPVMEGGPGGGGINVLSLNSSHHVQVMEGERLPKGKKGHIYLLRNMGRGIGNEIVDVTDPNNPQNICIVNYAEESMEEYWAVHSNLWEPDTGIAYITSSVKGWYPRKILKVYDLSDPYNPGFIRDFGLPGTQPGSGGTEEGGRPQGIHEVWVYADRIYLPYGTFDHGVLQILDRDKLLHGDPNSPDPFSPTDENLKYPEVSQLRMPDYWGAHSAKPIIGIEIPDYKNDKDGYVRNFVHLTTEGIVNRCDRVRFMTHFIDITDEKHPFPVSNFQVSATDDGFDFCTRGTFGPQDVNSSYGPPYYKKVEFISYFTAGVRAIDIRDPFKPVEIGYFIPKANETTASMGRSEDYVPITLTNSVETDERGYIYVMDRNNSGLHILELTVDID